MYAQALEIILGSFVTNGTDLGTIEYVGEEEAVITMRKTGDASEAYETPVSLYKLKVSFHGAAVETKEPAKVIEVVQHLLELMARFRTQRVPSPDSSSALSLSFSDRPLKRTYQGFTMWFEMWVCRPLALTRPSGRGLIRTATHGLLKVHHPELG